MKKLNSLSAIILLVLTAFPSFVGAGAGEKAGAKTFKERIFSPLKWGMSVDSFEISYPRADKIAQIITMNDSNKYYQDLGLRLYDHLSNTGFQFGKHGLDHIVVSYLFQMNGKELYQSDILKISKQILPELIQNYGKPTHSSPWNGQRFNYMWIGNITFVQFAWYSSDSWGIQFRSMEHTPEIKELMNRLGLP